MSMKLGNVSVLLPLLLLLVISTVEGSVSSAAGQDTPFNINASDIADLVDNVTERGQGGGVDDDSSFPLLNDDDNNNISSDSISSSSHATSQTVMINEIELNPTGDDDKGKEWIELYNPSDVDLNIGNFEIRTLSQSATIKLPPDAIIEAGSTYVIELEEQLLSNIVESLVLADTTDHIVDRTPSLVDISNDERTWQRIPDGNSEWQFVENTRGNLNDPDSHGGDTYVSGYSSSEVDCLGSAGCIEGMAIRIADGDALYVISNSTVNKVDLALIKYPL